MTLSEAIEGDKKRLAHERFEAVHQQLRELVEHKVGLRQLAILHNEAYFAGYDAAFKQTLETMEEHNRHVQAIIDVVGFDKAVEIAAKARSKWVPKVLAGSGNLLVTDSRVPATALRLVTKEGEDK